jgi:hypothetical protein
MTFLLAAAILPINLMAHSSSPHAIWNGHGHSAFASESAKLPLCKTVSFADLRAYKTVPVFVEEDGTTVKYEGVPLRTLFCELNVDSHLDTLKGWKSLAGKKIVTELTGDDGYPGLVTAEEIAGDKEGDRFILATRRDGEEIEGGPQLICKLDPDKTRWVKEVVQLRIVAVPKPNQ